MRRKLAAGAQAAAEGGPGADRSWRLSLARAARDLAHLPLEVPRLVPERRSLAELLELPQDRSLLAVLEGPAEGLGLIVLAPEVLAGVIEMQTTGRVSAQPATPRRPTRTDAAMVAGLIDAALVGLEAELAEEADLVWAGGFRYASFLEDARPLGLLLEDVAYRVLRAEVSLAQGAKRGEVILALPAEGRGRRPRAADSANLVPEFALELADRILGCEAVLQAVLARLSMPLATVMALEPGELLVLPKAQLGHVQLEGADGRRLSTGRLGQTGGMRALRLTTPPEAEAQPRQPPLSTAAAATG